MPASWSRPGRRSQPPPTGGGRRRATRSGYQPALLLIALLAALVLGLTANHLALRTPAAADAAQPRAGAAGDKDAGQPSAASKPPQATAAVPTLPFCQRDFSATERRRQDIAELEAAGGLLHLLKRKETAPPFQCADFYLTLGLDVDATGPAGLTALDYAIKANAPKMVQFLIDHGADLHKKAGKKQLEPMGYAYYLALNHPDTDRNRIIAIINAALANEEKTTVDNNQ